MRRSSQITQVAPNPASIPIRETQERPPENRRRQYGHGGRDWSDAATS